MPDSTRCESSGLAARRERPRHFRKHTPMAKKETAAEAAAEETKATKRILLVDDDGEIIEAMRFALESRGYTILVARDGNQGLAMAEREDPDLVILDMMMPKR